MLFEPLPLTPQDPREAFSVPAPQPLRFRELLLHEKGRPPVVLPAKEAPGDVLQALTEPRALPCTAPHPGMPLLMGVLNTTPDSFSDGGQHNSHAAALARAQEMAREGVDILDIGGESTRPGAKEVMREEERARTLPVIESLSAARYTPLLSIDTRKAAIARDALRAGAAIFNDVSALEFDQESAEVAAQSGAWVVLMHAKGTPETMQAAPQYGDVVHDVYHALKERVEYAVAAGVKRERLIIDPGIGFGKTQAHNLELLRHLAVFHGLGLPVLLGVSRKRFIGTIGGAEDPTKRVPGSVSIGLDALRKGVHILRIHDVWQHRQAAMLQASLGTD